jgi:hypothetical protein
MIETVAAEKCGGAMGIAGGVVAPRNQNHALGFFLNPDP